VFWKKIIICYQLRPDIETCGHRPRCTGSADTVAADSDVRAQKCLVALASKILFRIIWRCVNQVFLVRRISNSHNSLVWPEANSCSLETTTLRRQHLGGHCAWLFDWALLVTPTAQCTDLLCVFVGKGKETCGSSMTGLQLTLHVRSENISLPITTIAGLDEAGPVVAPSRSPDRTPIDFFFWCHIKALIYTWQFDSEEHLIARIVKASSNHQAATCHFWLRSSLCCVVFGAGCVSRSGALLLNICPKLVQNVTFLQNTSVVVLDFQLKSDPRWCSVVLQARVSDIQFRVNKSLSWSVLSPHGVRVCRFSASCLKMTVIIRLIHKNVCKLLWNITGRELNYTINNIWIKEIRNKLSHNIKRICLCY
jgi:hypothetical protein